MCCLKFKLRKLSGRFKGIFSYSGSQMPNDSNCQLLNRKKRRGVSSVFITFYEHLLASRNDHRKLVMHLINIVKDRVCTANGSHANLC